MRRDSNIFVRRIFLPRRRPAFFYCPLRQSWYKTLLCDNLTCCGKNRTKMACVIAKKDFGLPTHPHFECTSINTDEIFIEFRWYSYLFYLLDDDERVNSSFSLSQIHKFRGHGTDFIFWNWEINNNKAVTSDTFWGI